MPANDVKAASADRIQPTSKHSNARVMMNLNSFFDIRKENLLESFFCEDVHWLGERETMLSAGLFVLEGTPVFVGSDETLALRRSLGLDLMPEEAGEVVLFSFLGGVVPVEVTVSDMIVLGWKEMKLFRPKRQFSWGIINVTCPPPPCQR